MEKERIKLKSAAGHLKTINEHKLEVMRLLFKAGLYKQGWLHDLSKYSWTELEAGFRYYQGDRSANDGQKRALGYSPAWLHHKGRNKHHWHYWLDFRRGDGLYPIDIPYRYIAEMFCDRIAACKVYQKEKYTPASALQYFRHGESIIVMTEKSKKELEDLLVFLAENGEEKGFAYLRQQIRKHKKDGTF